jgi:hypothetical protein
MGVRAPRADDRPGTQRDGARLRNLLEAAGLTAPTQTAPPSGPQPGSLAEAKELAGLT